MGHNTKSFNSSDRIQQLEMVKTEEDEDIIVGSEEVGNYLALPREAIFILDWFKQGLTVNQVSQQFEERFKEKADIADFLEVLAEQKLIRVYDGGTHGAYTPIFTRSEIDKAGDSAADVSNTKYHFESIPASVAMVFFSFWAYGFYGVYIGAAFVCLFVFPRSVPDVQDLIFTENISAQFLSLTLITMFAVFLHEMGHLLAAKAKGVSSRLGISHRMWFVVAETDVSGVWSLPKKERYLAFLSGPLVDLLFAATVVFALVTTIAFYENTPASWEQLLRALLLTTILRLIWQCYFFMRTDFYYIFTNAFGCRNLMQDTTDYLKNQIHRLTGAWHWTDQTSIPKNEMKTVKRYSLIWLLGRSLSIIILFTVAIPVSWEYFVLLIGNLNEGLSSGVYHFADNTIVMIFSIGTLLLGIFLWLRQAMSQLRSRA